MSPEITHRGRSFFKVGSSLHCTKLKKYSCIILHINNYLILPEAKVEKMESCIFSEKVVIEISALKVRVFGKK